MIEKRDNPNNYSSRTTSSCPQKVHKETTTFEKRDDVFYINAGIYSISIIYESIYEENAKSDSAGRIQSDSVFST